MGIKEARDDFPVLQKKLDGKPIIYFDSAATSLKPKPVIRAMDYYYEHASSNVHRGLHKMAEDATEEYDKAREKIAGFINSKPNETILTSGATESFNSLMYSLYNSDYFKAGDEILLTAMEHHSNIVPWQFLARKVGLKLQFVELDGNFELNYRDLEGKISRKTKLVSVAHASNTLGTIVDAKKIGIIAKDFGALFAVDASQSIAHMEIDVKKIGCDFLAFSGHKILGPTGIGVLFGREDLLRKFEPFKYGGDMIRKVEREKAEWNGLPYKFEAGTPNISGALGMAAGIEYLKEIGYGTIGNCCRKLLDYALKKMKSVPNLEIYGPKNAEKQVSTVLFEIKGIDCHDLAIALDDADNIAIRSGMMCAEPLISSLNKNGLNRASFYFYNTKEEIDTFVEDLGKIGKALKK